MAARRALLRAGAGAAAMYAGLSKVRALAPSPDSEQFHYTPRNTRKIIASALAPGGTGALFESETGVPVDRGRALLQNMALFAGSSNPSLSEEIAYELHQPLSSVQLSRFADGEVSVQLLESIRGKDCYVIQSTSAPVNEHLLELLLMISAMRRASARSITCVIPYYGYKRDVGKASSLTHTLRAEKDPAAGGAAGGAVDTFAALLLGSGEGGPEPTDTSFPVSAADVARMLTVLGADRVLSVELQPPGQGQIGGFFPSHVPVENIRATATAVEHVARMRLHAPVVVAPNESCIELARSFRTGLERRLGEPVGLAATVEPGPSRGTDRYVHRAREVSSAAAAHGSAEAGGSGLELVGSVEGADAVIVDDLIDTGNTLVRRADLLKARGARRVVAYATHGLFNGGALKLLARSAISDVIVTNTVPLRDHEVDVRHSHKIAQLSIAPVLAEAVLRCQLGQTLQPLRTYELLVDGERYEGQGH